MFKDRHKTGTFLQHPWSLL